MNSINELELIKLYEEGSSLRKLSTLFGVSRGVITKLLIENNIEIKANKPTSPLEPHANEIISMYVNDKKSSVELAKIFNSSPAAVQKILKHNNVEARTNKIEDPELVANIIEKYEEGISPRSIGKLCGVAQGTVVAILDRNGIKRRNLSHAKQRYTVDEHIFDNITTEEQAYFLGLLSADGCNYIKRNAIILNLKEDDKELVEAFKEFMQTDKPLEYSILEDKGWSNQYRLTIVNKYLSNRLTALGISTGKTENHVFPEWLPKELYSAYFRGYFDGDGSIYTVDKGTRVGYYFCVMGTIAFLDKFQDILIKECSLESKTKLQQRHKDSPTSVRALRYSGNLQIKRIREYLYKDATVYLKRKYNKFYGI